MLESVRHDLIIPLAGVNIDRMLEFWRWLIPESNRPLFATALGDLFLTDADGRVLWLDMSVGQIQMVAGSVTDFEKAAAEPGNHSMWFGAILVDDLRTAGKVLGPRECYCYKQLPMLGGEYEPANFVVSDVVHHFCVWGPIHEKLKDIPDGTEVEFVVE